VHPIGLLRCRPATRWYSLRMKTRSMLTLDDCRRISAAAETEAKKNNWNVCITVHDDGGHLLHLIRMDGATPANSRIAIEKGRTAAETRRSTAMWEDRIKGGRLSMLKMPGVTPVQGGLPIVIDGACVGAVGVSGVQSHEDEQIAKAGIDALDR
jgi:glc operon protein GlcG